MSPGPRFLLMRKWSAGSVTSLKVIQRWMDLNQALQIPGWLSFWCTIVLSLGRPDFISKGTWFLGFLLITKWFYKRQWAYFFELDINPLKYILFLATFFLLIAIIACYDKLRQKNWGNWVNVVLPLIYFPFRNSHLFYEFNE